MLVKAPATGKNQAWDFHRDYLVNEMASLEQSDQPVIVYGCDDETLPQDVTEFIGTFEKPVLFHLSDQTHIHRTDYYSKARAVFRTHFDPRRRGDHVWFVPLGYVNGYANKSRETEFERPIPWVFAGQATKGHRGEMLAKLSSIAPNHIHLTSGWFSTNVIPASGMVDLYKQTVFVPCPFGNISPDTLRICEALEWGCLPVTVEFMGIDYFRYIFGDHPFIVARDWVDAAARMKAMLAEPGRLVDLQRATAKWYTSFKETLSLDLADIVAGRTSNLRSPQFAYQREGQNSRILRLKFDLHFGQGSMAQRYRLELRKLGSRVARYS